MGFAPLARRDALFDVVRIDAAARRALARWRPPLSHPRLDLRLFPVRTFPAEEFVLFGGWLDVGLTELPFHTARTSRSTLGGARKPRVPLGLSDASYPRDRGFGPGGRQQQRRRGVVPRNLPAQ